MAKEKCRWCRNEYNSKLFGDTGFCSEECKKEFESEKEVLRKSGYTGSAWWDVATKAKKEKRLEAEHQKAVKTVKDIDDKNDEFKSLKQKADAFFAVDDFNNAVELYTRAWNAVRPAGSGMSSAFGAGALLTSEEVKQKTSLDIGDTNLQLLRLNWAKCRYMQKKYDQAISICTTELKIGPNAELYAVRGDSYSESGNFEKAISDYTSVIKLAPEKKEYVEKREQALAKKASTDKKSDESLTDLGGMMEGLVDK